MRWTGLENCMVGLIFIFFNWKLSLKLNSSSTWTKDVGQLERSIHESHRRSQRGLEGCRPSSFGDWVEAAVNSSKSFFFVIFVDVRLWVDKWFGIYYARSPSPSFPKLFSFKLVAEIAFLIASLLSSLDLVFWMKYYYNQCLDRSYSNKYGQVPLAL